MDKICSVCGTDKNIDMDHIRTKAAGGQDLWPLCRRHHQERHAKGLSWIIETYPHTKEILKKKGFEIVDVFGRKKLQRI